MPEPWEDDESFQPAPEESLNPGEPGNAANWEEALAWFEREILPDFTAKGFTRGEALNAWMQQRTIDQLAEVMKTIEDSYDDEDEL